MDFLLGKIKTTRRSHMNGVNVKDGSMTTDEIDFLVCYNKIKINNENKNKK